jgi:hypothetical protein
MKFRLKAFGLHLIGSATALSLVLGALYLGWYHWPGWYLSEAVHVILLMVGVDVVLGPLLTLIVANSRKSLRELSRDIGVIVTVQLIALLYGATTLWSGRPLYYAFSVDCLEVVQASDIDPKARELSDRQKLALAPHWYSLPRWIWAPLPEDSDEAQKIIVSATLEGGADVVALPQYYKPWDQGLKDLHAQLKKVDEIRYFSPKQKKVLKERMQASGLAADQPDAIALMGRGPSLLAVIDPASLKIKAIIKGT